MMLFTGAHPTLPVEVRFFSVCNVNYAFYNFCSTGSKNPSVAFIFVVILVFLNCFVVVVVFVVVLREHSNCSG